MVEPSQGNQWNTRGGSVGSRGMSYNSVPRAKVGESLVHRGQATRNRRPTNCQATLKTIAARVRVKNVLPARTSGEVSWMNASWGGRLGKVLNAPSLDEWMAVRLVRTDM